MRLHTVFTAAFSAAVLFTAQADASTELTVYTAIKSEYLKRSRQAFEAKNPDISIK